MQEGLQGLHEMQERLQDVQGASGQHICCVKVFLRSVRASVGPCVMMWNLYPSPHVVCGWASVTSSGRVGIGVQAEQRAPKALYQIHTW